MGDKIDIQHFEQSAKKVFGEGFLFTHKNNFNQSMGYVQIETEHLLMAEIDTQMKYHGYICTNMSALGKNRFAIFFRLQFPEEVEN